MKKKVTRYTIDDLEISSDDCDREYIKTKYSVRSFFNKGV